MKKQRFLILLAVICLVALLLPLTASAEQVQDGFSADGNSYYRDGQPVCNELVCHEGNYYAFDSEGRLVRSRVEWLDDGSCYANDQGIVQKNSWIKYMGQWYYFGADHYGAEDFLKINGVWYHFSNGRMSADMAVYSNDYEKWYALSPDGTSHTALNRNGWTLAYGAWYYMYTEDDWTHPAWSELRTIGGKRYYFDDDYQLVTGELVELYDGATDQFMRYIADSNGVLLTSGWVKRDGNWCYLRSGELCENGVYEIGGKLYLFENAELVTLGGDRDFWGDDWGRYYVTDGSGVLYRNQWVKRNVIWPSELGWVYYGNDGKMVNDTAMRIGGYVYGFEENGTMLESVIASFDGVAYQFGADGKGKTLKDGWHEQVNTGARMYVYNGDLANGIVNVDGWLYSFSNGYMESGTASWGTYGRVTGYILVGSNGKIITKDGWNKTTAWYYIREDGTLHTGWLLDGGKWYYLEPAMVTDRVFYEPSEQKAYYAAGNGVCTAVTGNGLKELGGNLYYFQNGKSVANAWKQIDGYWYYFADQGMACVEGVYQVRGKQYLFDYTGKLMTDGWVNGGYGWCYADPANDSALLTGMQTIGGKQYFFDEDGFVSRDTLFEEAGVYYIAASDGSIAVTFSGTGWVNYAGNWYYCEDGTPVFYQLRTIGGKTYGFDHEGKMICGGIADCGYNTYYFAQNGEIRTGWIQVGSKRLYADPQEYYLMWGRVSIDGKEYMFDDDYCLLVGSFTRFGEKFTTDSSGALLNMDQVQNGWYLDSGTWYYVVDGNTSYDGWVDGQYLVLDGVMLYDQVVSYNGKCYYLQPNGKVLRGAWASSGGTWYLAKADGSLYCSEWVTVGGARYYFEGYYMVTGIAFVDGVAHRFDDNGKWLGQIKEDNDQWQTGLSDGWHQLKGNWYYYSCGIPYFGQHTIGGKLYYFADNGVMITNMPYSDYGAWYYYGSNGAAVEAVGWKYLNGSWYYFNPDHSLYFGMAKDSAGLCYLTLDYNQKTERLYGRLVTNEYLVIDGRLYYFDANGTSKGAISANGWLKGGDDWFYFANGALVGDGYRTINGAGYYFYGGRMVANSYEWVNGYAVYFGADGKQVTKSGWYKMHEDWVYVNASGHLYANGFYVIGGKEYVFRDYILISE